MKWLAVSQRIHILEDIHERRDELSREWSALAMECGFLPLFIPNDVSMAQKLLENLEISGVLLTGGNDLMSCGGNTPERDATEGFLIEYAIEKKLPLLGVCRGMQMLLDYFGTPLERVEGHIRAEHTLDNGQRVNSFHGFGAKSCQAPLSAVRYSEDGIVEEVVHLTYPWLHGIMWHPERYVPFRREDVKKIQEVFDL